MIQSHKLGLMKKEFEETSTRFIDEKNDMYPPPLMTKAPSFKATGFDRLHYAIMYFRTERVKELVQQKEDIFGKDYYGHNLISLICETNYPTNISYANNKELYDKQFFVVLEALDYESRQKLFDDMSSKLLYGCTNLEYILKELKGRPYMLLALHNYGLNWTYDDLDKYEYIPLRNKMGEFKNMFPDHKRVYWNTADKCSITGKFINHLALLIDGSAYEYSAIRDHLRRSDNHPLTGEPLFVDSTSYRKDEVTGEWQAILTLCKVIYIPGKNIFEHFE